MSLPLSAVEVDCPFDDGEGPAKEVSEFLVPTAPLAAEPPRQGRTKAPAPAAK